MALFRKLSGSIAPMFRKLPGEVNVFGRKLTNTATDVNKYLGQASKAVNAVDKVVPNPLTKAIKVGLRGAQDITGAAGTAGSALRAASSGDLGQAASLAQDAFNQGSRGIGEAAGAVTIGAFL